VRSKTSPAQIVQSHVNRMVISESLLDHKVVDKIVFSNAADSAEQPAYNPADELFYSPFPKSTRIPKGGDLGHLEGSPNRGAVGHHQ